MKLWDSSHSTEQEVNQQKFSMESCVELYLPNESAAIQLLPLSLPISPPVNYCVIQSFSLHQLR